MSERTRTSNRVDRVRRHVVRGARVLAGLAVAAWLAPACSLGEGTGTVSGTLDVPDCWSGPFDLKPDFFAAVPSTPDALLLRIQNGGDFETFSDGLAILVDDAGEVRGDPLPDGTARPSLLGQTLVVSLPAGVTPPGVPLKAVANPSIVHATLYLEKTCRTQNVALYAMDAVTTNPDGTCDRPEGGEPPLPCGTPATLPETTTTDASMTADASASADATTDAASASDDAASVDGATAGNIATSTIVFNSLFDGNLDESNAAQRLTDATFRFYLADPREICPGGLGPPPRCRGLLTGNFNFYFQRGRPAQPFP